MTFLLNFGSVLIVIFTYSSCTNKKWKPSAAFEQRNSVFYLRGPYNYSHYKRNNKDYRTGAAAHWAHGAAHDMLLNSSLETASTDDRKFLEQALQKIKEPPRTEPHQDYVGPVFGRLAYRAVQAMDWAHMLHEQLYDIMADDAIPTEEKKKWIDRAVDYYLAQPTMAFSPAPLEVTLERVGIETVRPNIKTYFSHYPKTKGLFFGFHWWHPEIYEVQLIYGEYQEKPILEVLRVFSEEVIPNPPNRMLLSREMMPRFSQISPEAANIFDNLHMFHGIVYGILASPDIVDKRNEIYRVIDAMTVKPGDHELAKTYKVPYPHPDVDPLIYEEWMWNEPGEMGRIMHHDMKDMKNGKNHMKMNHENMDIEHEHIN